MKQWKKLYLMHSWNLGEWYLPECFRIEEIWKVLIDYALNLEEVQRPRVPYPHVQKKYK